MTNRSPHSVLPQAPVDLIAVATADCRVILAWTECGAGGLGFRIARADGNSSACRFSEIGSTGPQITAFSDEFVKPRTTYSYRVHAWNASGDSPTSNTAEVTTPKAEAELSTDQ
ncbi:MAG: fibronectin type III domain-containing protein [Candidatus Deferrimicrobiaceae bacterium]